MDNQQLKATLLMLDWKEDNSYKPIQAAILKHKNHTVNITIFFDNKHNVFFGHSCIPKDWTLQHFLTFLHR